jgi:hypothetical protein
MNDLPSVRIDKPAIEHKSAGQVRRTGPSWRRPRRVLVRDIHVQMIVAIDLEEGDLAIIRHPTTDLEPLDRRLQTVDISCP